MMKLVIFGAIALVLGLGGTTGDCAAAARPSAISKPCSSGCPGAFTDVREAGRTDGAPCAMVFKASPPVPARATGG